MYNNGHCQYKASLCRAAHSCCVIQSHTTTCHMVLFFALAYALAKHVEKYIIKLAATTRLLNHSLLMVSSDAIFTLSKTLSDCQQFKLQLHWICRCDNVLWFLSCMYSFISSSSKSAPLTRGPGGSDWIG
jgi:hypothetical protein